MRLTIFLIFLLIIHNADAQIADKPIKLIPEISLKTGSQQPAVGGQFALVSGIMLTEQFFTGIGFAYATNMGMGGTTFPLYLDARYYFHPKTDFLFKSKDTQNDFQIDVQMGVGINPDRVFKTGFIAGIGFAYKFDFLKINDFKLPDFYLGLNIEYNYSKYYDEYLGFVIKDGYLTHTILNLKLAFDFDTFHFKSK
ncbi:MAG: hypothetical protein L3J74_18245 [Bacteroidales bacterium]|nr:hypothetical protein [Bacteroidales bacterium]